MGHYDVQQVCINGHQITARYNGSPEFRKKFCNKCGAETIHQCPNCNYSIKGSYEVEGLISIGGRTPVPTHCENCGKPYPWVSPESKEAKVVDKSHKNDPLTQIESLCSRFHLITKQLRSRHEDRMTLDVQDEYDVQDLLHALLRLYFDDIRPEEWTPSYAGGSSRIDFLLKNERILIEVKKTRQQLKAKQIGDQLIIDINRYKTHPDCKLLFCFVYDPEGIISNPRGLENDLNGERDGLRVEVMIVP
ncbi:MAG: DUF2321 domain-containing protein [Candidatus Dadabacteria bacterium]|nr:MAG: DUF2321 domain-containing protein [Candidatus Dadabacteria bacterium]